MHQKMFVSLLAFFLAFASATQWPVNYYGVDVSQGYSAAAYRCLVGENLLFAIVRCYQSVGRPDPNCASNVANAIAGGMRVCTGQLFLTFRLWMGTSFPAQPAVLQRTK